VPDWFSDLRIDTARDLDRAEDATVKEHHARRHLEDRLAVANDALAAAERDYREALRIAPANLRKTI
jgi:hypothetical protein